MKLLIILLSIGSVAYFISLWILPASFVALIAWTVIRINKDETFNDDCMTDEHYNEQLDDFEKWIG